MTTPTDPPRPTRPSPGPRARPAGGDSTTIVEPPDPGTDTSAVTSADPDTDTGTAGPGTARDTAGAAASAKLVTEEDVAAEEVATIAEPAAGEGSAGEGDADRKAGAPGDAGAATEPATEPAVEPVTAAGTDAAATERDDPPAQRPEVEPVSRTARASGTLPPPWRRTAGTSEPGPPGARPGGSLPPPGGPRRSSKLPSASRIPAPSTGRFRINDRGAAATEGADAESAGEPGHTQLDTPTRGFRRPPGQAAPPESRVEQTSPPGGFPMSWPRSRRPRQANLQLKRLDPWSVLKIALVLAAVLYLVWMVAVGLLYGVLNGVGVWDRLNGQYADLVAEQGGDRLISAGRVFVVAALIGAVNSLLVAVGLSVGAFIYNVSADLVGGIELTLSERD
ncbi:DUF3566 domain-containing protein [Pseudonocardia acaciae]|uniref:DUF3566 domain-containing protein n=1 Tax=Pseudonocardia acaciae TaxID=551276 RepID=UPI000688F4E2